MPDIVDLPAILLVTSSKLTQKAFEKLLSEQYEVVAVESAVKAWQILQKRLDITVIICELKLAIDGDVLLERIRRAGNRELACLPVLLLIGENDDEESQDTAFSQGATDFINMPFSSVELKTRVGLHAGLHGLYRKNATFELASQNSPVDILNSLMQEKFFLNRLDEELSFSARHKSFVSVCLLKVDDGELIIEQHGKKILRAVLRAVAKIIEEMVRREDTFAFLGEQTFAILYPVTNGLGANTAVKRLIEKIQGKELRHEGTLIKVTASAGIYSTLPTEEESSDRVMDVVEQRLIKAENLGGNQIVSSKAEQGENSISIEQALNMIKFNRPEILLKQIPDIIDKIIPLMEFVRQNNELEFNRLLDELTDEDE